VTGATLFVCRLPAAGQETSHSTYLVAAEESAACAMALVTSHHPSPVYLVDFSVYQPPAEYKVDRAKSEEAGKNWSVSACAIHQAVAEAQWWPRRRHGLQQHLVSLAVPQ
jgi:hypothetical protein